MDLFTKMTNAICKRGAILSVQERVLRHFGRREEARVILRALSSHHDMASEILTPKSGCPNMGLKVGSAAERWNDEVFPLVLRGVVDPEIPGFDAPTTAQYKIDQYIQKRMDGMEPHPPARTKTYTRTSARSSRAETTSSATSATR